MVARFARLAGLLALVALPAFSQGCSDAPASGPEALGKVAAELTKAERIARYEKIKAAAAARGINSTAFLLAGIAYAETGLAHCWSEATWACKGPNSADCGGGPVIAGAGDGPCADKQGGLGMFQFDAGTFTDTLNKYGNSVLTVAGNVDHAINYVINMVKISTYTTNAETDAKALAWIANFNVNNSTLRDQWIKTVTHYYNGCKPTYSCWSQRYAHYNDSLQTVLDETGLAFWGTPAVGPKFKGAFVSQSFPFASQPFELPAGSTKDGFIELRNEGEETWKPGEVFLGTTEPRDGKSPLAAPGWVNDHRAATVEKAVAPGQTGRFNFAVKAPATPGDYPQYFNLVREGVAWFSDGGQGGPPDDQLQIRVTSVASPCPAGVGADWVCQGNERVRCEPSSGAVTSEPCPAGCSGGQCLPSGGGGSGGSGQAGSGSAGKAGSSAGGQGGSGQGEAGAGQGEAGAAGSVDEPGAGGSGDEAGAAGQAGSSGKAGSAGKAGSKSNPGKVTLQSNTSEDDGGCSYPAPGQRSGAGGGLLALLGLVAARRRRAR